MKKIQYLALGLLTSLSVWGTPAQAAMESFESLALQPDLRQRQENRLIEEGRKWQNSTQPAPERLFAETQMHVFLSPRHASLRPLFQKMLAARPLSADPQAQELHYYQLLNMDPQNASYRQQLAGLLIKKHPGYSQAQVQQAYRHLNDAFNAWDEGKVSQALQLFKFAALPNSPELTAIYAHHLRDSGQPAEALRVVQGFKGPRNYLHWFDDLEAQLQTALKMNSLDKLTPRDQVQTALNVGELQKADGLIKTLPEGPEKHWFRAKWFEKRGQYHPAYKEYMAYYQGSWAPQMQGFVPVVYKAQLEDINSLELIAQKFRTSVELIRRVNQAYPYDWVETYRMLVIPVVPHSLHWPTHGYVSSHYGYRLHPIRGTWRLHEGLDIETLAGVPAQAAQGGNVLQAGYDRACGHMLRINHPALKINTVYCHGAKLNVKKGAAVNRAQQVMVTGNTGSSSASNHLHFGVQQNGVYTDPMDWL